MATEARYPELDQQSIIVTGGTRGIGLGIVRVLARAGAKLVVTGRKQERLDAVAQELSEQGVPHVVLQANQAEPEAAKLVAERALEAFGRIDGLVANAQSYLPVTNLLDIAAKDFDYVLDSGPKGTLWLMQAVHPHMQKLGRGRIVTFGSSLGNTGAPGYGPYAAAKEAMRSLTRTAAREWGRDGITVNLRVPGLGGPPHEGGGPGQPARPRLRGHVRGPSTRSGRRPRGRHRAPPWPSCSPTPAST